MLLKFEKQHASKFWEKNIMLLKFGKKIMILKFEKHHAFKI